MRNERVISMDLVSFVVLAIIAIVVSLIMYYGATVKLAEGGWGVIYEILIGYVGALWGAKMFGTWLPVAGLAIIPAILGSFTLIVIAAHSSQLFSKK